ncbi:hypothetical protein ACIBL6_04145 [Streptomyces sp. NPDC050400]|uniref:bestrophin-like domain n=1 Tax=Streptomyces sp. NPDC050400 TaxID=3365610 RepID=UPI00378DA7D2
MDIWLLNHFSTVALAGLLVGGAVFLGLAGCLLVRRYVPRLRDGEYNEMAGVVLGMYAAIYGIILAFVIVAEWEGLDAAEANVAAEATQSAEVLRDSAAFPPAQQQRISAAMGAYVHAVVDEQWPQMRKGTPDPNLTNPQTVRLYRVLQDYEPATEAEKTYYTQAVTTLGEVAGARRTRLEDSQQSLPILLSVLVYGGALVMLPLTWLYGIKSRTAQMMFVTSVAVLIGVSLLLCLTLDHPFSGSLAVSPDPFKEGVLARYWP